MYFSVHNVNVIVSAVLVTHRSPKSGKILMFVWVCDLLTPCFAASKAAELVVKCCFGLATFYPIKICS